MKFRHSLLMMILALSLILMAAGCAVFEPSDDAAIVAVISTQVEALPTIYQWLFDNESGCAIEVIVSEATLAQTEGTATGEQLHNWRAITLLAGSHNTPVDALVLGPDYDGSFLWPLTLTEYVAPDGTADPACGWLPKDVQVQGPSMGENAVTSVITAQGEVKKRES